MAIAPMLEKYLLNCHESIKANQHECTKRGNKFLNEYLFKKFSERLNGLLIFWKVNGVKNFIFFLVR